MNWHLSVAACNPPTTTTSPCGHLKSCVANIPHTKSFALHSLKRESTWQRESKLICVWNANVTSLSPSMCLRALRAFRCCKNPPALYVLACVKWRSMPNSFNLNLDRHEREPSALGDMNIFAFDSSPPRVFLLVPFGRGSQKEVKSPSKKSWNDSSLQLINHSSLLSLQ